MSEKNAPSASAEQHFNALNYGIVYMLKISFDANTDMAELRDAVYPLITLGEELQQQAFK